MLSTDYFTDDRVTDLNIARQRRALVVLLIFVSCVVCEHPYNQVHCAVDDNPGVCKAVRRRRRRWRLRYSHKPKKNSPLARQQHTSQQRLVIQFAGHRDCLEQLGAVLDISKTFCPCQKFTQRVTGIQFFFKCGPRGRVIEDIRLNVRDALSDALAHEARRFLAIGGFVVVNKQRKPWRWHSAKKSVHARCGHAFPAPTRLYIAAERHCAHRMLLLVASILVSSASIYEGHNAEGVCALLFALVVSELGKHKRPKSEASLPSELITAIEVALSVVVLAASPDRLSVLSWALTIGCLGH